MQKSPLMFGLTSNNTKTFQKIISFAFYTLRIKNLRLLVYFPLKHFFFFFLSKTLAFGVNYFFS